MAIADWGTPISYIVGEELEELKQRIVRNMQAAGAVATGKTIQSIEVNSRPDGGALTFRGRMPFGVMETGRKGGRIPYGFTSIIYDWMQAKGIHGTPFPYKTDGEHKFANAQERGDYSMASAIAHTIAKSGTKLYREGGRDTIYSQEIPQTVTNIKSALMRFMFAEVKSIKLNGGNTI